MKRRIVPALRAASSSTCVPYVLFIVNASELPNELSTCVCAAKCITVSTFSAASTNVSRSIDWMSPLTNLVLPSSSASSMLRSDAQ